jgi:hypothetical protein
MKVNPSPGRLIFHKVNIVYIEITYFDILKYLFLIICEQDTYFLRYRSDRPQKYSETDISSMLGFLVDNIHFGDQVFQQSVGILIGTNCAPLLTDLYYIHMKQNLFRKMLRR